MSIILTAAALAAAPIAAHQTSVTHHGETTPVTYQARLAVTHKQVGFAPPARASGHVRCDWTATVTIERQVGGATSRVVSGDHRIKGSRPGDCMTNRRAIAKTIQARQPEVQQILQAAADHDHAVLVAELGAAGAGPTAHAR